MEERASRIRGLFARDGALSSHCRRDKSGVVANVSSIEHPELAAFEEALRRLSSMPSDARVGLRYRRYDVGYGHRGHLDAYEDADGRLVATFMFSLGGQVAGGETVFTRALDRPLAISHAPGLLVWWDAADSSGATEERTWHEAREVRAGTKELLLALVWRREGGSWELPPSLVADADASPAPYADKIRDDVFPLPTPRDALGADDCPGFFCVQDSAPSETVRALRVAAEHRGVAFYELRARSLDLWHADGLPPGSLLYAASTTAAACAAFERLWRPTVATVHSGPSGPLAPVVCPARAFEIAEVAVPPWAPLVRSDPDGLKRMAEALGGFPLVLRFPGGSGGVGVVRVDTLAGFVSLADFARSRGQVPEVKAFIDAEQTWRVVVVDGEAVGGCLLDVASGDFRSSHSERDEDWPANVPAHVAAPAVRAAAAVEVTAAGVDLVCDRDGGVWVLEANTPFYFGHHQSRGQDVAGALVVALLRRAAQILGN